MIDATGLVPVDRWLAARSVTRTDLPPPRGLSPRGDDWWARPSIVAPRRPSLWEACTGLPVIRPPGQARWSYCTPEFTRWHCSLKSAQVHFGAAAKL